MAVRTITTRLTLDGEQEFKREMGEVNSRIKTQRSEMQLLEEQFKGQANTADFLRQKDKLLRDEIEQQEEKVRALERALKDAADVYGDTDKKTDGYRQSLNRAQTELLKMNRALEDNSRYLDEAERSADRTAGSIDEMGREIKKVPDDPFDKMAESLGDLKNALMGGAVVGGIKEVAGALIEVVDGTQEYRQIMGTLEVSSRALRYTSEETEETFDRFHDVLGDTQTAATATANLQALKLEQDRLMRVTDMTIGAWARYGDSIPIDGLAESVNETIKAGQVTGTFADVLNWGATEGETYGVKLKEANEANKEWNTAVSDAKSAEDFFNLALQEAQTEAERTDLVLQAMAKQGLEEQASAWRKVNEDIVNSNEAQRDFDEAMGELGETLAPVRDGLYELATVGIGAITEAAKWAIEGVKDLIGWLNDLSKKDRETYGSGVDARGEGRRAAVSGSHAGGLDYVPFDGYVAELHQGERVQTREEADWWRSRQRSLPGVGQAVTAAELQAVTAAAVNALRSAQSSEKLVVEAKWIVNGREFYADTIEDFRAVARSSPEVKNDG